MSDPTAQAENLYRAVLREIAEVRADLKRGLEIDERTQQTLAEILAQVGQLFIVVNREATRGDKRDDEIADIKRRLDDHDIRIGGLESPRKKRK